MYEPMASTLSLPPPLPAAARADAPGGGDDALGAGTRLDEFEIVRVLGAGGFGIVYLALDHVLQRQVAIKEYMPSLLARRGAGAAVSVRSADAAGTFARGLESFFNEARLLAGFDHPALVKVHRFWKANGTAYMAMQYYPGLTLKQARRAMPAPPDEAWLRALLEPLLGALELLHREGVFHRDIAPDNILLLPDGRPVLLDFGAARRVIGAQTQTLTAVLKPNFSPIEQYADDGGLRQGPWTDLYALGATVHFMLTGEAPTPSVMRVVKDAMPALSATGGSAYAGVAQEFLAAIDWTLALAPDDRPQSVAVVRRALSRQIVPPPPSPRHRLEPPTPAGPAGPGRAECYEVILDAVPTVGRPPRPPAQPRDEAIDARPVRARAGRSKAVALALCLALAGAVVLGWRASRPEAPATDVPALVATSPPAVVAAPMPADSVVGAPGAVAPPRRARTEAAAARSPRAACGDLNFLAMSICLERECRKPRWHAHAQCAELRGFDEQRRRNAEQP